MSPLIIYWLAIAYVFAGFLVGLGLTLLSEDRAPTSHNIQAAVGTWVISGLFWPLTLVFLLFEGCMWLLKGFSDGTRHL